MQSREKSFYPICVCNRLPPLSQRFNSVHLRPPAGKNRARCVSMTTQRDVLSCKTSPVMHLSASTTNWQRFVTLCSRWQAVYKNILLSLNSVGVETLICCRELNISIFTVLALQKTCYVYGRLQTVGVLTHHVMSLYISSMKNSDQNSDVKYIRKGGKRYRWIFLSSHLTH